MRKSEERKKRLALDEMPDDRPLELLENAPDEPVTVEGTFKQANRSEHYRSKPAVSRQAFLEVLAQVPDVEPVAEDKK